MPHIVPAILEKTKEDFLEKVFIAVKLPGIERVQVDFADGAFVPNITLPAAEMDPLNPAFHWEAHLMINEPKDFLDYEICGFKTIILHYEAYPSKTALMEAVRAIKTLGLQAGVCINSETPVSSLLDLQEEVRHFQLMSIVPGFQGSDFLPGSLERIRELRKLVPTATIEVDGGIGQGNIKSVAEAGADLLICGSSLVKAPNPALAYEALKKQLHL